MMNIEDLLDDFVNEFKQKLLDNENKSSNILFLDYCWHWFNTFKISKEKNTQFMYANIIKTHFSFLSGVFLVDIRQKHIQAAINKNIVHPRICELILLTFKQVINCAVREKLFSRSVALDLFDGISLPKKIKKNKRPLSDLEKKALKLVKLPPMKETFLFLIYYTGIRKGEALALCRDDFDFDNKILRIRKNLIFLGSSGSEIKESPKSSNGIRDLPLPEDLILRISDYVLSCDSFLFHGQGVVLANRNFYRRFWDSIVLQLNIAVGYNPFLKKIKQQKPINDLTAHIFRHDYCTQLCYQVPDISTKMIAYLLGDSEKMVLEVYSHVVMDQEKVLSSVEKARKL